MLFLALFFVLLCIGLTLLFSPVVIRYTKDKRSYLVVHFVFFSVTLSRKTAAEKEKERKKKKESGQKSGRSAKGRAVLRALRYAVPRTTVCVQSLPLPTALPAFWVGIGTGVYYSVLAFFLSHFDRYTSEPLLSLKNEETAAIDLCFQMRFYTFLHTFLIYLVQYRKEKEARISHVGNENE